MRAQKYILLLLLSISLYVPYTSSKIRIILTAALPKKHYDLRKKQYIESFKLLHSYGYDNVYVVEALAKKGPTFLDDYSSNVFYSQENDSTINPGYNEARTLLDALYHFNFDPEDIIIKLTGRDHLLSNKFIEHVEKFPEIDAFFKPRSKFWLQTELYAMRCKDLIKMCEWFNATHPTATAPLKLEEFFSLYLRPHLYKHPPIPYSHMPQAPKFKIKYVKKLGVRKQILGTTTIKKQNIKESDFEYY